MRFADRPVATIANGRVTPDVALREAQCALESHILRGANLAKVLAIASVLADPGRCETYGLRSRRPIDHQAARDLMGLLAAIARHRFATDEDGCADCLARLDEFLSLGLALRNAAVGGHS